jgi:NAD(P)-dependent dehydrogenase (short-subunit alcohol dehydrogenase family)
VIVTGGGSGIGRALCFELGRRGAHVIVADIDAEAAAITAKEITSRGQMATSHRLDVTQPTEVKLLIDDVAHRHGRIDVLFNNAGIGIGGEAQHLSLDDWRRVLEVNLFGVINGVQAAYPRMIEQGFGHIVNTASIAGLFAFPIALPYTTSKHAVVGLSRALRAEGAALGVKVSVVCPASIDTNIWGSSILRGQDKSKVLGLLGPMMSAERCALAIVRGVERNRGTILVTGQALLLEMVCRVSPALGGVLGRAMVRRYRRVAAPSPRDVVTGS